jgi:adenosylcobinamide kinase/adenosylcobinamide-phosphate guanylyltransferase
MAKLILVTGGSRSGKSSYALELGESSGTRRLFIATCPNLDEEMANRVYKHQQERTGRDWQTVEEQLDLATAIERNMTKFDVMLIDCLTLWVNNLMFDKESDSRLLQEQNIVHYCQNWLTKSNSFPGTIICVTNEVGMGIVPDNPLARKYRDLVGACNQAVAAAADQVILVSCGLPLVLK